MGDLAPIPVSVEMYPLFKSRGGIAAASVLARAAGGRASLPIASSAHDLGVDFGVELRTQK
jgi:hypothetical protein